MTEACQGAAHRRCQDRGAMSGLATAIRKPFSIRREWQSGMSPCSARDTFFYRSARIMEVLVSFHFVPLPRQLFYKYSHPSTTPCFCKHLVTILEWKYHHKPGGCQKVKSLEVSCFGDQTMWRRVGRFSGTKNKQKMKKINLKSVPGGVSGLRSTRVNTRYRGRLR